MSEGRQMRFGRSNTKNRIFHTKLTRNEWKCVVTNFVKVQKFVTKRSGSPTIKPLISSLSRLWRPLKLGRKGTGYRRTNKYIASTSLLVGLPRGGFQLEFRGFEIGSRWNCDLPQLRLAQSARCDSGDVLAVMTTTGECHASHHHFLPVDGTWSKDF